MDNSWTARPRSTPPPNSPRSLQLANQNGQSLRWPGLVKVRVPWVGRAHHRAALDASTLRNHVIRTWYHVHMTRRLSVLAPILRSETQARLLAALLLQPGREASIAELAREVGADAGNLHDEVERLVKAGILADRRVGRTRLLRATDSPLARPLADLLLLGYGPKPAAERALRGAPGVEQAFIGGSWAARYEGNAGTFPHDIDIIVVGSPDRDELTDAVVDAMHTIGLDAQVIFRSRTAWRQARDAFTRTAKAGPLVELDLSKIT